MRLAVSRDGSNYSFVSRDAFIPRGLGYRDPVKGSFTLLDSEPDAGFVFSTAGGLLDPDALAPQGPGRAPPTPSAPFPFVVPSARVGLLYWGAQRTHGGSAASPGFQGILRATLRREGFVAARSPPNDPVGAASFTTVPLLVPSPAVACSGVGNATSLWLLLNARTAVAGSVAVTLLNATSLAPLAGFDTPVPFTGDAVRTAVGWATTDDPARPVAHDIGVLAGQSVVVSVTLVHAELFAWEVQCVDAP